MLNILFYTSFNTRSRDTESLMQAFVQQGHKVFMLSQMEKGSYHEQCEKIGVHCYSYTPVKVNSLLYFFKHTLFLLRFCKTYKIHVVYAHLENAGLPAVLCQPFVSAKIFTCRHIVDEAELMGSKKFQLLNKIVYGLSRNILVVSERSKQYMVEKEGVSENKIRVIRLAYNFNLYPKADQKAVEEIRQQYGAKLLLLTACRMMEGKRPLLSVNVCKKLVEEGLDVKLILVGEGPLLEKVKTHIKNLAVNARVFALGYRSNIMDFLSAADLLLHPSLQDSSSVIIKEAGLNETAVIACKNIGDVDEYLVHEQNALLVNPYSAEAEMYSQIKSIYQKQEILKSLGQNLKTSVLNRFDISLLLPEYDRIHKELEPHGKN